MTNTYAPVEGGQVLVPFKNRTAEIFLETHHHLINPRFYTAEQISTKDTLLLRQRWREYDRAHEVATYLSDVTGGAL